MKFYMSRIDFASNLG